MIKLLTKKRKGELYNGEKKNYSNICNRSNTNNSK